jgi:uncharacterized protein YbjQ (UPF0145 family)/predicted nucleic-acid-binding Zn-ribbon protein
MEKYSSCPNCGAQIKSGLLSSVSILEEPAIKVINESHDKKSEAYCTKCGIKLYETYSATIKNEKDKLAEAIRKKINCIPIVSTHSPLNWDYSLLEIVTGQSTTGTGIIAEIASSWTDFFGRQSGMYNEKIKLGENLCFAQIRKQTIDMGGNAIIATDIDYSELGSIKGMIMVCTTGTAIKLNNLNILGEEKEAKINEVIKINARLLYLERFQLAGYN